MAKAKLTLAEMEVKIKDFHKALGNKDAKKRNVATHDYFRDNLETDDFRLFWADDRKSVVPSDFTYHAFIHVWNKRTDGTVKKVAALLGITDGAVNSYATNKVRKPFKDGKNMAIQTLTAIADLDDNAEHKIGDKEGKPITMKVSALRAKMDKIKEACAKADKEVLKRGKKAKEELSIEETMSKLASLVEVLQ